MRRSGVRFPEAAPTNSLVNGMFDASPQFQDSQTPSGSPHLAGSWPHLAGSWPQRAAPRPRRDRPQTTRRTRPASSPQTHAEHPLHRLHVRADRHREAGSSVAQLVRSQPGQPSPRRSRIKEARAEIRVAHHLIVRRGEHKILRPLTHKLHSKLISQEPRSARWLWPSRCRFHQHRPHRHPHQATQ